MDASALRVQSAKQQCDQRLVACCEKHNRLRRLARNQLEEEIQRAFRGLKISVEPITERALGYVDTTWTPRGRKVAFNWRAITKVLLTSHPRRLDIALWSGNELCGLAVARLSDNKQWLSLTHLEGAPNAHTLKTRVAPVALVAVDIYATLLQEEDAQKRRPILRVLNPLKETIHVYALSGYSSFHKANGYTFVTEPGETP